MTTMTDAQSVEVASYQVRDFQVRAVSADKREVEGIAVPWGEVADLGWFTEEIQRGAVRGDNTIQLWWRHSEPIGVVTFAEDQDGGYFIRAKISETPRGDEAFTLLRDGVIDQFSIGFETVAYEVREDGQVAHIIRTEIIVREVSLVPFPAYDGAQVQNVRQGANHKKGNTMPTTPAPGSEVAVPDTFAGSAVDLEARAMIEDLERRFGIQVTMQPDGPHIDTRSAGEILKAVKAGDQGTIDTINGLLTRAYTGGTTADAIMRNSWVGDLTRIVEGAAPLLDLFSSGDLPDTGMTIEFGRLKTNTVVVSKQANQGDDLPYGKVAVETDTAPVDTFGGYGELSFQAVERSSVNLLNTLLLAQAIATGKALNLAIRALFTTIVAAQVAANNTVSVQATGADYADWIDAIVDAAIKFDLLGLPITGIVANATVFKALGRLTAADGRPVLLVQGDGNNNVGTFNPAGLKGNLAGITIVLDAGLPTTQADGPDAGTELDPLNTAVFVNENAIRVYRDPIVRLQDENIVNLSKQFSVYVYAAMADEIPQAIVPVVWTA